MDAIVEKTESENPLIKKIEEAFDDPKPEVVREFPGKESWEVKQVSEKAHLIPARRDKHEMLALNTPDSVLYRIFNEAADEITKDWGGFHQIGAFENNGLTAWEIWGQPGISEEEILTQTKEKMLQIVNEYI